MPEKLDDEKIQDVIDTYEREGTIKGTAEKTGVSKSTVDKYVKRHKKQEEEESDSDDSPTPDSLGSMIEMSDGNERLVDLTDQELMEMSEAEFIRSFFQEFDDMGVRDSFAEMVANQAQLRHQIPDEDQMSQRLQSHNSGIGNANDANAIAELYWALAQRYLNARGLGSPGGSRGGTVSTGGQPGQFSNGDWVSAPDGGRAQGRQGGPQQGGGGEWVGTNPGQSGPGQQPQGGPQNGRGGGGMEQMFQQMMAQQQQMMREMMNQQQEDEKSELRAEIERLREEVDADDSGGDNMTDSLKELMELREMLNQLEGDDGDERMEQVVGTLQQQLSALQQEIRDGNSSVDMAQMASGGDSQMGMLMALAQSGDVDPDEMVSLAQKLGEVETNPQVAEKKYEKQIEEMKVEAEQEKWESILNGVEELTTSFGGILAGGVPDELAEDEADERAEAEPETTATARSEAEPREEEAMSPAERLVAGGGEAEARQEPEQREVESEGITPDSAPEEQVEVEVVDDGGTVLVDEEADFVPDDAPTVEGGEEAVEAEAVADEPEEDDDGYVCEFCGRSFERERQRRGHLANCPERDAA